MINYIFGVTFQQQRTQGCVRKALSLHPSCRQLVGVTEGLLILFKDF